MDNHDCIKYDMCHIVKSRIRHNNTKRAYCVKEEGYECAFFLPKIKPSFDKYTNMSCDGCEAEDCATACQDWINEHDAAIARQAREDVLKKVDDIIYAIEENGEEMSYEHIMHELESIRRTAPQSEQGGSIQ